MNKALKSMIVLKYENQENFSEQIGVSRSIVSNVIRGRRELSLENKIQWAEALGCSVDEIFSIDYESLEKGEIDYEN